MCFFFFNDTATTEIYTLSLHDALPIFSLWAASEMRRHDWRMICEAGHSISTYSARRWISEIDVPTAVVRTTRSEEHTSELQSRQYLVCRLLLEKNTTKRGISQRSYILY